MQEEAPVAFTYMKQERKLHIVPSRTVLEGLYYDVTPPGAPPQQITQCQQWGFQRMVPCIDEMTAKCTYSTTIIADARYTHLLSNGDVVEPLHPVGSGRQRIRYDNTTTPMAPYLFFLAAGTYAEFRRTFEYPDGKSFRLELLVPPGTDPIAAERALDILEDAVLWVYLCTGPEMYDKKDIRTNILRLTRERERLKKMGADQRALADTRAELARLSAAITPGYIYTGTVYREIGMQNSDFGGMENVGNTTITTNRILPFPQMTDPAFEYMGRVKAHEYYHNLNGSEVTGQTPFELWLNEAVTVLIENKHHAFHFGTSYNRLETVLTLLAPDGGTFSLDTGAASLPIEPDGFDDPNDLVTGITYVKGAEFVRMVEALMGKTTFAKALALYHRRYRHGNATRAQWVGAMEEVSGQDYSAMAAVWLKQTGFPVLTVDGSYDAPSRTYTFRYRQSEYGSGNPWIFPLTYALVDNAGRDLCSGLVRIDTAEGTILCPDTERPAFVSLNREYTLYGRVRDTATTAELHLQARNDPDLINRFIAFTRLADLEKRRLLDNAATEPSDEFLRLFTDMLCDQALMEKIGGQILTIFESIDDEVLAYRYQALYDARLRIYRSIARRYEDVLLAAYETHAYYPENLAFPQEVRGIKIRQVRNVCLNVLSSLDSPEIHARIKEQFRTSKRASDRLVALGCYLNSSAPDRITLLQEYEDVARRHPVAWEGFLTVLSSSASPDTVALVRRAAASEYFHIEQATEQRALFVRFALNRKKSLQTEEGRAFLQEWIPILARLNEFSTIGILRAFGTVDRMEEHYRIPLISTLVAVLGSLDPKVSPGVGNMIRRLLQGAPDAVARYRAQGGEIPELESQKPTHRDRPD
jgi:aminopeptidase N